MVSHGGCVVGRLVVVVYILTVSTNLFIIATLDRCGHRANSFEDLFSFRLTYYIIVKFIYRLRTKRRSRAWHTNDTNEYNIWITVKLPLAWTLGTLTHTLSHPHNQSNRYEICSYNTTLLRIRYYALTPYCVYDVLPNNGKAQIPNFDRPKIAFSKWLITRCFLSILRHNVTVFASVLFVCRSSRIILKMSNLVYP